MKSKVIEKVATVEGHRCSKCYARIDIGDKFFAPIRRENPILCPLCREKEQ